MVRAVTVSSKLRGLLPKPEWSRGCGTGSKFGLERGGFEIRMRNTCSHLEFISKDTFKNHTEGEGINNPGLKKLSA